MTARLFRATRTAMQQGKGKNDAWTLEFENTGKRSIEPLMGWTSGSDMMANQVRLKFQSKEEGLAYAASNGLMVQVEEPSNARKIKPKAYADNFAQDRVLRWTH